MKALVVGTNYGATYLRALTLMNDGVAIAGIFSTGSERSKKYAQLMNVAHFTTLDEIPTESIDFACVAVQGQPAIDIALALLDKGIHVLCEHPLGAAQMISCLDRAKEKKCIFQVNAHFAELPASQVFFNAISTAEKQSPCLHIEMSVNLRTLYSGLDILGRTLGSLDNITLTPVVINSRPRYFESISLSAPGTSISLLCQNFSSEQDDGTATLINHRFSAIFPHGNLLLAETTGPILWFPTPVALPPDVWRSYLPIELTAVSQQELSHARDLATLSTAHKFIATIQGQTEPLEQQPTYLIQLASLWEKILAELNIARDSWSNPS